MVISPVPFPSLFPQHHSVTNVFPSQSVWLQRGAAALMYGLDYVRSRRQLPTIRLWVPAYICRELVDAIDQRFVRISYYAIDDTLSVDQEVLEQKCRRDGAPDVLLVVHYFGYPTQLTSIRAFCDIHRIVLIEDCAHVLRPKGAIGTTGDMSFFSPSKFVAIPKAGVLCANTDVSYPTMEQARYAMVWVTWYGKRICQRVLGACGVVWYWRTIPVSQDNIGKVMPRKVSSWTENRCVKALYSVSDIEERRRAIATSFMNSLQLMQRGEYLFPVISDDATPYMLPIRFHRPVHAYVKELRQRGVPAVTWPALPNAVSAGDEPMMRQARHLADHVLFLPIHQSMTSRQCAYLVKVWLSVLSHTAL